MPEPQLVSDDYIYNTVLYLLKAIGSTCQAHNFGNFCIWWFRKGL